LRKIQEKGLEFKEEGPGFDDFASRQSSSASAVESEEASKQQLCGSVKPRTGYTKRTALRSSKCTGYTKRTALRSSK